ncbi:MAG TPA: hypothetical protein PKI11_18185 [Candidatus Hydrogenedentes bacterium]|nr:hypothetical protein [Candidatus Hydrogenedentota bacterium]
MSFRWPCLPAVLGTWLIAEASAWACDSGTVRDAAFSRQRDVHRLCVFAAHGDPDGDAIAERLDTWLTARGDAHNLRIERVFPDDPEVTWSDYGIPSRPPRLPATALIGESVPSGNPFVIGGWEPAPEDFDGLLDSPARETIKAALATHWAVLLHAPELSNQSDTSDTSESEAIIGAACATWAEKQPPGLAVVRLQRDDPRERIVCALARIPPQGPDWLGVVFGKGTLLAPPLTGDDISEDSLNRLLETLATPCTCLHQSVRFGLDLPMLWDDTITERALAMSTPVTPVTPLVEDVLGAPPHIKTAFGRMTGLLALGVFGAAAVSGALAWGIARRDRGTGS